MPISKALIVGFGKKACICIEAWKMLNIKYGPGSKTITLIGLIVVLDIWRLRNLGIVTNPYKGQNIYRYILIQRKVGNDGNSTVLIILDLWWKRRWCDLNRHFLTSSSPEPFKTNKQKFISRRSCSIKWFTLPKPILFRDQVYLSKTWKLCKMKWTL